MFSKYRKSTSGSRVKFDSDPSNDGSDGRSQGIRWAKKHIPDARKVTSIGMVVYCTVAGIFIGALSLNLYNLLK